MPRIRNWQEWDEDEPPVRTPKKKKAARPEWADEIDETPRQKAKRKRGKKNADPDVIFEPPPLPRPEASPEAKPVEGPLAAPAPEPTPAPPPSPSPHLPPIRREEMRRYLTRAASRPAPAELIPLQIARAVKRGGPAQIYKLIQQGTPVNRLANALALPPEMVTSIYQQQQAIRRAGQALYLYESGAGFAAIAQKLNVSETEAKRLYATGYVARYGADPAVQYGIKRRENRQPFPSGIFEQPTFVSDTNRGNAAINHIIGGLRQQLEPHGYRLETAFEADVMGGRYVVKVVKGEEIIGQPFRLTATPNGVPLISKTGKPAGGYRLTQQGQGTPLDQRLGQAILQMAANDQAYKARLAHRTGPAAAPDDDGYLSSGLAEPPPDHYIDDDGDWSPEAPAWLLEQPSDWDDAPARPAARPAPEQPIIGQANGPQNVLDLLDVGAKRDPLNEKLWRPISGGDFMRLSHAGRFREENSEALVKNKHGQWDYPEGLAGGNYIPNEEYFIQQPVYRPLTPIVSKGTVYPLEARNYIAGNIELEDGSQWGSQAKMGKQVKRDELSLTRKYWQAGPALGVAYEQVPQHILGQRATEPEMAYTARAFILDRGGIIPEGQMWKDVNFAPWVFGSFEQNPEKYELRFDPNYSEQEVLAAAGLLGADGQFRPRMLGPGQKVASPSGFKKDILGNHEAGVITGYEIVETLNERGDTVKALRFKGYFGDRPNVVSAMKLEGWKNLAQDKHIRQKFGLDVDIITNRPSDPVVANISMLNALPRQEFEALWTEVHGDRPAPRRTETMADLEALARVWQRYQEKNRGAIILPGQVVDADTLQHYLEAGIVKDGKYEKLPPLFEGAEPQYKLDLIATGYYAPVRVNFVTDVTDLRRGRLSNEILRNVEHNFPGLGEHLRDLGYPGRDIYHTLFEMYQLNTQPGYREYGSPVVDLIGDLTGNRDARAGIEALYQQKLAEILPESMAGLDPKDYTPEQEKAYRKFKKEAGAQAIRQYYDDLLGTDSYIFRLGTDQEAAYMVNPGLVERFGFIDEETGEQISRLKKEGDDQLKALWTAVQSGNPRHLARLLRGLPGRMKPVIQNQAALLASAGARKKWFGTSDRSIRTHVHASDYALPRNAIAMNWADIFGTTGLKRTRANRAYLNKLSRAGQLLYSGIRNPASDPVAQTGTILNMVTPDILKAAGLDIPTTGHPVIFHPHQIQAQGGDNDSDESQVYLVLKQMAGDLVNAFGLQPSDPGLITKRAQAHAAGEYADALKKLNVTEEVARQNRLGFDPNRPAVELAGSTITANEWQAQTLEDYQLNARQIGQAYNLPIRVGANLADNPAARALISEYGGWLYQNPLDKVNYQPGSPEEDLFSFFTSFDAFTGGFSDSDHTNGKYYSYRQKAQNPKPGFKNYGFENRGQFGAAGLLAILKRLTEDRAGTQAQMTQAQMAAMITRTAGDLGQMADFIKGKWNLPDWEQLNSRAIKDLVPTEAQLRMLQGFATGDSPLAQMMRGYAVRNAIKGAARMQRKLLGEMQNPDTWADQTTKLKNDLRNYLNIFQNEMYNYGKGSGSAEFKADYRQMLQVLGLKDETAPQKEQNNYFTLLDPKSGEFYRWPVEKRQKFYQLTARLLQKYVTGYNYDQRGNLVSRDESVSRNNPFLRDWYPDYDRIRDQMAVNAREREDDIEGWAPTLAALDKSEVTGPLVREKYRRKQKLLDGLSRLFETYKEITGLNGQAEVGAEFENFVLGKKPYTPQEQEMFRQAELGHQEAARLREERRRRQGYEEPLYFAEGGVLTQPTRLGQTPEGRPIIGGEAGREYVVPEGKTRDLGDGLKLFDMDELGRGAPRGATELAKGGILDYQAYAHAPTRNFEDAIRQVAYELTGGQFTGDVAAAKELVRQRIEADIRRLAANPPQNGLPGLMASSMSGRATELMALALGPNPAAADFSMWNDLLAEYGLSADLQPLGVNPQQIDPAIKKQLLQQAGGDSQAYRTALAGYMKQLNTQLAGKGFSHANYGHIYNAIPGWQEYWNNSRPPSTVPAIALSGLAQANLSRLIGGAGGNNGGPPPQSPDAGAQGSGGAREQRGREITAYSQPFSPQTVALYKTLAEKLNRYASTIEELNLKGATLADASGEVAQVIRAAGKTYHRLEGQYSRAQRVLRYDALQAKFDDFLYREGEPLSDEESRELSRLQEQMTRPTGAEVSAAAKVKGYIQDIFPIYAEREAAGRRGTRLPRQLIANSPLSWAAQIAGRDPGLVKEGRTAERQALRLGQIDRRLGDVITKYDALEAGSAEAFMDKADVLVDARKLSTLSRQRQALYEQAVPVKQAYEAALGRGDYRTAQGHYDTLARLNEGLDGLRDEIATLTPYIKENVETIRQQTRVVETDIREREAIYGKLLGREEELRQQAIGASGDERKIKEFQATLVQSERERLDREEIQPLRQKLGQFRREAELLSDWLHEPQGRQITGLGKRPVTPGQAAWGELVKGYDPQRLFWQFQNIQQMQYMAFMPMLRMRQQYLAEQMALGQAQYALGAGGMPQSVLEAQVAQANMGRAATAFGRGVDNSMAMHAWRGFTNLLADNQGLGNFLGAAGFDLTSGLTALMAGKMIATPLWNASGKLLAPAGRSASAAIANYLNGAGTAGGARLGLSLAGLGTSLAAGGGLLLGGGVNQALATWLPGSGAQGLDKWASVLWNAPGQLAAGALGYLKGYEGEMWGGYANPLNNPYLRGLIDRTGLPQALGWDLFDEAKAAGWEKSAGNYLGVNQEPTPVWITKIEEGVARKLGTDKAPFDRAELAQMGQAYAEIYGISQKQLESDPKILEKIIGQIADSYTSGVGIGQSLDIYQKVVDVSGYAPGTAGATHMAEWINQGSQFERQQKLQAAQLAQNVADALSFSPEQRHEMSRKVYDLLAGGASQAQVARSLQQRAMSNQYYWSAAAYEAGLPHLALMDGRESWRPKYQREMWAIEDRRRNEDIARELGAATLGPSGFQWQGGRQEVELGWQRQKLGLEEQFWQFRRKSQLEDFQMQQKLFDFNIRQMRFSMEWEEKQSRTQSQYYERQYQLNKRIFDLQAQWQRQDFDKQESRLSVQRGWQMEDSAWNRETFNLQAGWQMEDLQRALRYASSGRERMDIRRQIERAGVLQDRQRTEMDREDARAGTRYGWAVEGLQTQRQRFEEMNALQREQMELGRQYWQEQQSMSAEYRAARKAMLEEQIALLQEQNALNVAQFQEGMRLADEQHQLERDIALQKQLWAEQDLELARQRAKEDEIILGWQREIAQASQIYQMYQQLGYEAAKNAVPELEKMVKAAGKLADEAERYRDAIGDAKEWWEQMPTPSNPAGPALNQSLNPHARPDAPMTPVPRPFARGGPVEQPTLGLLGEAGEEYVVPSSGALVLRESNTPQSHGSAEVVALLAAILAQLQEGGGTILIDEEKLKRAGFIHADNFSQVYR